MENIELVSLGRAVKAKLGVILLFGLVVSLLSFYAFIFTQKKYETSTDFLIIQDQEGSQDFYSLSKSAEYLGGVLSEAIYSTVFIEELKKTDKVEDNYFPLNERDMMKKWKKAVKIERSPNLGILKVNVYDDNKNIAVGVSQGISEIMVNKNHLFRGKLNMEVRVLSGPLTEKNPSITSIFLIIVGGFIVGSSIKILYIYFLFLNNVLKSQEQEEYLKSLREIE